MVPLPFIASAAPSGTARGPSARTLAGKPAITQCTKPFASGSVTVIASSMAPVGTPVHSRDGDTFVPSHVSSTGMSAFGANAELDSARSVALIDPAPGCDGAAVDDVTTVVGGSVASGATGFSARPSCAHPASASATSNADTVAKTSLCIDGILSARE